MEYTPINPSNLIGQGYLPTDRPLAWALDYTGFPVATSELAAIVSWYPVVFARTDDGLDMIMPSASAPGQSCLINEDTGLWVGKNLPFFLRSFPFAIEQVPGDDGKTTVKLLVAAVPEARMSPDAPRTLIEADGTMTDLSKGMISRILQHERVRALDARRMALFDELSLFMSHHIDFGDADASEAPQAPVFLRINEQAVMDLPMEAVERLHALKAWRMIYGHLFSLRQSGKPRVFRNTILNRQEAADTQTPMPFDILDDDSDDLISF